MPEIGPISRREFVATTGTAAVASLAGAVPRAGAAPTRARYAMVGTGHRGTSMWGAEVLAQVIERDARDMGRADAPLRPAKDAVEIDTTTLSIDEAVAKAIALIAARLA